VQGTSPVQGTGENCVAEKEQTRAHAFPWLQEDQNFRQKLLKEADHTLL